MSSTILTAAREYASRPKDEQFLSVAALVEHARFEKDHSAERAYNVRDLQIITPPDYSHDPNKAEYHTLRLQSPKGTAKFTHWSFGQLCRTLGAPAGYLRDLPPSIAANALNHGLQTADAGDVNLLVKANGGEPIIRACTSDSYGRVWDADIYGGHVMTQMMQSGTWSLPPVWGGGVAGAYRGDRDSFLIVTNGGSIVTDPSVGSGDSGAMYRGIMIRNSEVGASSVVIETVLYRYICGNHMIWGAIYDSRFRRRHIGTKVTREVVREIGIVAQKWADASVARDNAVIRSLIDNEIAHTKEAVIDELRKMKFSKDDAETAYAMCEQHERVSPRTYWGIAQGATRASQTSGYQDERYMLDKLAADVMARGAKLVTA